MRILTSFEMPLGEAALVAVLGLIIVFAVLAVLVGILTIFKVVFTKLDAPKKKTQAQNDVVADVGTEEDDAEIVAAITAAVCCMAEEERVQAPFRIKSIRRLK